MDDRGQAWVGSEAGNAKSVELCVFKQPHGGLSKHLEVGCVLRWGTSSSNTPAQGTPPATSPLPRPSNSTPALSRMGEPHWQSLLV